MINFPLDSWNERRIFSRFEAELDYLLNCDKDGKIDISIRELAKRWKWEYTKVFRFVNDIVTKIDATANATKMQQQMQHSCNCISNNYKSLCNSKCNKNATANATLNVNKKKIQTVNYKARVIFENYYRNTFMGEYYWEAKDAGSMAALIRKITHSRQTNKYPIDDDSILEALKYFLSSINDSWILKNFSVTNINSKYNEIRSQIQEEKKKATGMDSNKVYEDRMKEIDDRKKEYDDRAKNSVSYEEYLKIKQSDSDDKNKMKK